MNAFLTGSQVYGTPTEDSDVDLVIRCDDWTVQQLVELLVQAEDGPMWYPETEFVSVKVGRLNLLCCLTDTAYAAWRAGTAMCIKKTMPEDPTWFVPVKPLTREEAVAIFSERRQRTGQSE